MDVYLPQIILVLLLVFLNGFFVASELSLVAVRRTRLQELVQIGNARAKRAAWLTSHMSTVISATQLGITVSSLVLGWIGEPLVANFLEKILLFLPMGMKMITVHTISICIGLFLITFFHVLLGEVVPKTIALHSPEKVSLFLSTPFIAVTYLFTPFVFLLNICGKAILTLLGVVPSYGQQSVYSEQEIKLILNKSGEQGAITKKEVEMVYNVFQLGDIPIKNIMTPLSSVVAFSTNSLLKDAGSMARDYPYSRYPVYEQSERLFIGYIHIKDVYKNLLKTEEDKKIKDVLTIRPILPIPANKRADEVLVEMRRQRIHFAQIVSEKGNTEGIVTLEDVVENIIGEIHDASTHPHRKTL